MILKENNLKQSFLLFFTLTSLLGVKAQTSIEGIVKNNVNKPLYNVNVLLKKDGDIITYGISEKNGHYRLKTSKNGNFKLVFSTLGYQTTIKAIIISKKQKNFRFSPVLVDKTETLNEVIIETDKPISIKGDTITFKTNFFTDGTEDNVEDLLKKIPGTEVDANGTVTVNGQEVEKIMVGDDDIFGKGYKLLSKNMPAYPIEDVQIFKHYSNNRLLKGVEQSDKIALNLNLNKKFKRIWFGNLKASLGNKSFYRAKANVMNFGKKNKYYFLGSLNNIGENATGELSNILYNTSSSIGDDQYAQDLIGLSPRSLNFKKNRSNFNNAKLLSLNAIFNPSDKLKIKPLVFLNWDKNNFFRKTINTVQANGSNFTNRENYNLESKKRIAFGQLKLKYDISENQTLKSTIKYNNNDYENGSDLVFNSTSTVQKLNQQNKRFDQKIEYTNRFKPKKAFTVTGRYIDDRTPQYYSVNKFFFKDLFPGQMDANSVAQKNSDHMQFAGINARLLDRKKNENLLELNVGNSFRKDDFKTQFSLFEEDSLLGRPENYQNKTNYQVNDLYAKGNYDFTLDSLTLTGSLGIHQLFNRLESKESTKKQSPFFVNPEISLSYDLNDKNIISTSYSYNTTNAKILDVYGNHSLRSFRSFSKGTGNFNQLDASKFVLSYVLGSWQDNFYANTSFYYGKSHDFFSTNSIIEKNYSQSQKILIHDRDFLNISGNFNYFIDFLSSNIKLKLNYSQIEFKNVVNNSGFRRIENKNFTYGFQLRSGFNEIFNFHIGTKWVNSKINSTITNSYTNNESFLNLYFVFNDKFDTEIEFERYYFGSIEKDPSYYFLGFSANYKLIKNKLSLGITGKNLFNTKTFRDFSISDIGTSTTTYRLLPRMLLLKAEFRF